MNINKVIDKDFSGGNFITSYDLDRQLIITILSNIEYDVEVLHEKIKAVISE